MQTLATTRNDASQRGLLLAGLLVLAGCGRGPRTYDVSGTVTYDGKIVPNGTVTFLGADERAIIAPISPEGRYRFKAPAGVYRVGVHAPRESSSTGIDAFKETPKPPYVPANFGLPELTGIEVTVEKTDDNQIDLPLISGKRLPKTRGSRVSTRRSPRVTSASNNMRVFHDINSVRGS